MSKARLPSAATVRRTPSGRFSITLSQSDALELKELLQIVLQQPRTAPIWDGLGFLEALHAALAAELWQKLHGLVFVSVRVSLSLSPVQAVGLCEVLGVYSRFAQPLREEMRRLLT